MSIGQATLDGADTFDRELYCFFTELNRGRRTIYVGEGKDIFEIRCSWVHVMGGATVEVEPSLHEAKGVVRGELEMDGLHEVNNAE